MQVISSDYWAERSLFYLCKMFADQIHRGDDYGQLKKCIHIGILDFTLFEDSEYYSRFRFREDHRQTLYSDKLEIHVLELPKLGKYEYPETELLRWARFFNAENKEELEMAAKGNEYTERAYDQLVELSADEEKRLEYEQRQKALRDALHMKNSAIRQGLAEGHERGLAEGRAEGLQYSIEMLQELGISKSDALQKIIEKFSISESEARKYLSQYWK